MQLLFNKIDFKNKNPPCRHTADYNLPKKQVGMRQTFSCSHRPTKSREVCNSPSEQTFPNKVCWVILTVFKRTRQELFNSHQKCRRFRLNAPQK